MRPTALGRFDTLWVTKPKKMKTIIRLGLALQLIYATEKVQAQAQEDSLKAKNYQEVNLLAGKQVGFITIERHPMYPNGQAGINAFLSENLIYPEKVAKKKIQGEVVVDFLISEEGKVQDIKVIKGNHPLLEQEAVRVIRAMDRWIPARQGGKPVKMRMQQVIMFNLKA